MNIFRLRRPLLGIDLGASSLKAVRLLPSRQGIKLDYIVLVDLPYRNGGGADRDGVLAFRSLAEDRKVRRSRSVINAFGKPPLIRRLTLPTMPKKELKEAVKWEAKKLIHLPMEEVLLDFLTMSGPEVGGQQEQEILLVAAEKDMIAYVIRQTRRAGLRVVAVDASPLSLLHAARHNYPDDLHKTLILIDIGAIKTEINIAKDSFLRFTRTVQFGGHDLTASLEKQLGLSFEEAERLKKEQGIEAPGEDITDDASFTRFREVLKAKVDHLILEVQRSIDYYRTLFRDPMEGKIILTGGTSLMPGFSSHFSSYFDIPIQVDDPLNGLICGTAAEPYRNIAPRFTSCIGLALRELIP